MEEKQIIDIMSSNSIAGAGIAAVMAMAYKIWRILKTDRKEDNLEIAERSLRDELRDEIKMLKEEIRKLVEQIATLAENNTKCLDENSKLKTRLRWLETCFQHCKDSHPPKCTLLKHIGTNQFHDLTDRRTPVDEH